MIKKYAVLLALILFCGISAQAIDNSSPIPNTCYGNKYPVSNSFSRGIQRVFGLNIITTQFAEMIIKNQISHMIQKGKIGVNLKGYSAGDLIAGKVKSFEVTGKNVVVEDIYISSLKAKSLCDFTNFDYRSKPPMLQSPLFLGYSAEITNSDLTKIFATNSMKESLQNIQVLVGGLNFGKVDFTDIKPLIAKNKINMKANMTYKRSFLTFTLPINFETGFKVLNDKIYLTKFKFAPNALSPEMQFITDSLELNNIEVFDLNTAEKNGSEINVKKITVSDKISIEGTFWQPSNTVLN
jgi:hypothetical protein